MLTIRSVVFSLCLGASVPAVPSPLNFSQPIGDARTSAVISQAAADFAAVVAGKPPVHAQLDQDAPVPADGGTSFFKAPGYSLTVVKSLVTIGGVNGYIYGPVIRFDQSILIGNSNAISQLSFYSSDALQGLLKGAR